MNVATNDQAIEKLYSARKLLVHHFEEASDKTLDREEVGKIADNIFEAVMAEVRAVLQPPTKAAELVKGEDGPRFVPGTNEECEYVYDQELQIVVASRTWGSGSIRLQTSLNRLLRLLNGVPEGSE